MKTIPNAHLTAIYCRKSRIGDKQQITVSRQKRLALADCEKLGLTVAAEHIYIDNGASAWRRNRKRPGWDELIQAAKRGEIKHIVCYHPDRLMRQPFDLEELLSISDDHGITLYGRVNARDLQDPDDRYALRIEIAHACRSSDDTSRRVRDKKQEIAESGYYNGIRPYGYSPNGMQVIEHESEIVKEIFRRFTKGEKPYAIAVDLNRREIPTARNKAWTANTITRQLRSNHVTGISVYHAQEIGTGKWPAIIKREQWNFAQELLAFRSATASDQQKTRKQRYYILRGLVVCGKCGTTMAGCSGRVYRCTRAIRQDGKKCARAMLAEPLEKFIEDAAVELLARLTLGQKAPRSSLIDAVERAIAEDEQQLRELHDMWINKEIDSAEYRKDRRIIQARIRESEKKTAIKSKSVDTIADVIGPDARSTWANLSDERKNSVLRFLFSAVIIGPGTRDRFPTSVDYGRIEIEQNELG